MPRPEDLEPVLIDCSVPRPTVAECECCHQITTVRVHREAGVWGPGQECWNGRYLCDPCWVEIPRPRPLAEPMSYAEAFDRWPQLARLFTPKEDPDGDAA